MYTTGVVSRGYVLVNYNFYSHFFIYFCFSELKEVYEMPSQEDLNAVSGLLEFTPGMQQAFISVYSLDDKEEEPADVFSVKLIAARGGARVSPQGSVALLKGAY